MKLLPVDQGYYYYFTLTGLTAVQMNDRLTSVLHGTKNGQPYYSATDDYSIANYNGKLDDLSLRVTYTDRTGKTVTTTVSEVEAYNAAMQQYAFSFQCLLAAELRGVVSVQVYEKDSPVSCTLEYSADTYGNNRTGDLLTLCKVLFAYSDSVKNNFN